MLIAKFDADAAENDSTFAKKWKDSGNMWQTMLAYRCLVAGVRRCGRCRGEGRLGRAGGLLGVLGVLGVAARRAQL